MRRASLQVLISANPKHKHYYLSNNQLQYTAMNFLTEEHYRLRGKLKELDHEEHLRKTLVQLCAYKVLALSKGTVVAKEDPATSNVLTEKVHDYERRVSVLKQQLSTKEKVHDAVVEDLKTKVAELSKQLEQTSRQAPAPGPGKRSTFLSPPSTAAHHRSMPQFTDHSFFSPGETKSVFSKLLFSPVLSRPSLVGARAPPLGSKAKSLKESLASLLKEDTQKSQLEPVMEPQPNVFSSPGTSADATPIKKRPQEDDAEIEANLTTVNHNTSVDENDSFRSASADLLNRQIAIPGKSKKSKIRLLSTDATRVALDHGKGLLAEDEEINSLDFYNDDNFAEDNHSSLLRPAKRPREESEEPEETPRKKHVFKI